MRNRNALRGFGGCPKDPAERAVGLATCASFFRLGVGPRGFKLDMTKIDRVSPEFALDQVIVPQSADTIL
jgi:hypothetical protein